METGGVGPKDPVEITLRRVDSLTVSELDDIRADFEAQLHTLPEVCLWQVRDGPVVGLGQLRCLPGRVAGPRCHHHLYLERRDR
jgi:hypothetical protein